MMHFAMLSTSMHQVGSHSKTLLSEAKMLMTYKPEIWGMRSVLIFGGELEQRSYLQCRAQVIDLS